MTNRPSSPGLREQAKKMAKALHDQGLSSSAIVNQVKRERIRQVYVGATLRPAK